MQKKVTTLFSVKWEHNPYLESSNSSTFQQNILGSKVEQSFHNRVQEFSRKNKSDDNWDDLKALPEFLGEEIQSRERVQSFPFGGVDICDGRFSEPNPFDTSRLHCNMGEKP
ncbi:hypothetical protein TNCV_3247321 [Trichonephila clavipes]|nr:hypothetical protein TNCV_3247321 [Trichonephila clavipes]